ncbi:MAG: hypothetical protein HC888_00650 [Candidatus Competibacteraceae bacterium]|nr:hypothetical protein [Candidatus Competibacteraceae bacterium]
MNDLATVLAAIATIILLFCVFSLLNTILKNRGRIQKAYADQLFLMALHDKARRNGKTSSFDINDMSREAPILFDITCIYRDETERHWGIWSDCDPNAIKQIPGLVAGCYVQIKKTGVCVSYRAYEIEYFHNLSSQEEEADDFFFLDMHGGPLVAIRTRDLSLHHQCSLDCDCGEYGGKNGKDNNLRG